MCVLDERGDQVAENKYQAQEEGRFSWGCLSMMIIIIIITHTIQSKGASFEESAIIVTRAE